jgi:hypothetical protein
VTYRDERGWRRAWGDGLFEVAVSPDLENRALLTLDRALRHCQQSGLTFVTPAGAREVATFIIEGIVLTLRLFESAKRLERELTKEEQAQRDRSPHGYLYISNRYSYTSTRRLRLEARTMGPGSPEFVIVDGTNQELHDRIGDLPEKLMQAALYRKAQRDEWEEYSRRAQAHQRMLTEKAELKRRELKRLEAVEQLALDAERAARLRRFTELLESCGQATGHGSPESLAWIRNAADWLDPLTKKRWPEVDDTN